MRALALAAMACLTPAVAAAQSDTEQVRATVAAYHAALAGGDSAAALTLLTDDAVVLESGGLETRDEYRAHHLPADIRFSQAVPGTRTPGPVTIHGDVAWASSTSETRGTWNGRAIASAGAELMVLVRTASGWRIAAIHWSSRPLRE